MMKLNQLAQRVPPAARREAAGAGAPHCCTMKATKDAPNHAAEDPDHVINFNGERFLGPHPDVMPAK